MSHLSSPPFTSYDRMSICLHWESTTMSLGNWVSVAANLLNHGKVLGCLIIANETIFRVECLNESKEAAICHTNWWARAEEAKAHVFGYLACQSQLIQIENIPVCFDLHILHWVTDTLGRQAAINQKLWVTDWVNKRVLSRADLAEFKGKPGMIMILSV